MQYRIFIVLTISFLCVVQVCAQDLAPCPNSPNCVSTKETRKRKRMSPIPFSTSAEEALQQLESLLHQYPNTTLIKKEGNYLHYTFRTKIGKFIDDVEFLIDAEAKVIHFRSTSRTGYGDFGKNKRRMKKVRRDWEGL